MNWGWRKIVWLVVAFVAGFLLDYNIGWLWKL